MNEEINKKRMIESLEQLRAEKYSNVPQKLVSELIDVLSQENGNIEKSQVDARSIIAKHLNSISCSE